jgi:hypothetical protein
MGVKLGGGCFWPIAALGERPLPTQSRPSRRAAIRQRQTLRNRQRHTDREAPIACVHWICTLAPDGCEVFDALIKWFENRYP